MANPLDELGVPLPTIDTTVDQPAAPTSDIERLIQSFSGLEGQSPITHPRNFLEGLVSGGAQSLGAEGTRRLASAAKMQAIAEERAKARNEANARATLDYQKARQEAVAKAGDMVLVTPAVVAQHTELPNLVKYLGQKVPSRTLTAGIGEASPQDKIDQTVAAEKAKAAIQPDEPKIPASTMAFYVDKALADGTDPPFGKGFGKQAAANRLTFSNAVAAEAARRGITGSQQAANVAGAASDRASLTAIQRQYDLIKQAQNTAHDNADMLLSIAEKIPDVGARFANKPIRELYAQLGNDDVSNFEAALQPVQTEFARILQGGTTMNGPLTDSARKELQGALGSHFTYKQLVGALNVLKQDSDARARNLKGQVDEITKRLQSIGKGNLAAPARADSLHGFVPGGFFDRNRPGGR